MVELTYLGKKCTLHTAWAEYASGPGWSNTIYWAVVSQGDGPLEKIAIQPDEQSDELKTLFQISEATHQTVVRCMARCLDGESHPYGEQSPEVREALTNIAVDLVEPDPAQATELSLTSNMPPCEAKRE